MLWRARRSCWGSVRRAVAASRCRGTPAGRRGIPREQRTENREQIEELYTLFSVLCSLFLSYKLSFTCHHFALQTRAELSYNRLVLLCDRSQFQSPLHVLDR